MIKKQNLYYSLSNKIAKSILRNDMECLSKYALILIKPETLVTNKLDTVFSLLEKYNFEPVYFKFMKISGAQVVSLWNDSWINVSLERALINQIIFEENYSLVIILKNSISNYHFNELSFYDASTYITYLKGSANEKLRIKGTFRDILKPLNYIINYIHTSDDTKSMIREIGVLFSINEIHTIFNSINENQSYNYEIIKKELIGLHLNQTHFDFNLSKNAIENLYNKFCCEIKEKSFNNNLKLKELINSTINNKTINYELLCIIYGNNLLKFDWNHLIVFTTYIKYKDKT